jgi:hypothetical protein
LQEEGGRKKLTCAGGKGVESLVARAAPAPAPSLFFYLFFSLASVLFFFPTFSVFSFHCFLRLCSGFFVFSSGF